MGYSMAFVFTLLLLSSIDVLVGADKLVEKTENSYLIQIPKHVRPGFEITFSAAILESSGYDNPVSLTSNFASKDHAAYFSSRDVVNVGETRVISLGKVPVNYAGSHDFTFAVDGTDSVTGDQLFSLSTTEFDFASKALTILIQTDKAIYKPGQTIKFRGVVLHPDLRPVEGDVRYSVLDHNDNVVLLNSSAPLDHGVVGGEFELHRDASANLNKNGATYKIIYEVMGYKEELEVTVQQYKLPKFKVEVEAPSYIWTGSEGVTLKLKATYTYGKPVKGVGYLTGEIRHSWGGPVYYASYDRSPPFGPPPSRQIKESFPGFNGEVEFFISKEDLAGIGWNDDSYSSLKLFVTGKVSEEYTDVEFEETIEVDLERTNIKVDVLYKPKTIKPGLTYSAMIKVSEKDGKPLQTSDVEANNMLVQVTYSYPWRRHWRYEEYDEESTTEAPTTRPPAWEYNRQHPTEEYLLEIPPNGIVTFNLDARDDDFEQISVQPYTNATERFRYENQFTVPVAKSPSKSFMQIISNDLGSVAPGDTAHITIKATDIVEYVNIMVLSRGSIISDEVVGYSEPFEYYFPVTHQMTPSVKVLASYIREDGEVVADYLSLSVSLSLENQVQLSSSADSVDAGDDVTIDVLTSAGAFVGARAIDQSVLLLKSGNDITTERVAADLNGYTTVEDDNDYNWWWWWPIPSGADDAKEVYEKAGIIVLTDATVYEDEPELTYYYMESMDEMSMPMMNMHGVGGGPTPQVTSRSYFPETWLWDSVSANEDGSAQFNLQAPDTITSWILSVFSVSDEYGLGLTDPMKITVFRNFFVNLNVPLKVTRGEIVVIQAIVFNYFQQDLNVRLELETNDKFELIVPGDDFDIAGPVRDFVVPAEGAFSISFPVTMSTVGDVPFTVKALSPLAADVLTRNVFVKAEGIEQCYSYSALIDRSSDDEPANVEEFEITMPPGIIEDSGRAKLYVYGDIMGSTANNLGALLKEPRGCGEQNMLSFAPDVFVTKYLEAANRLDAETREKAYKHFLTGYQNELNYRHNDGSYSAFGQSDKSGSTWLTAFVAKCFAHAAQMRPDMDEQLSDNIQSATLFLTEQQTPFGTFAEPGKVSHKAMQGGVDSDLTMAAYVLITLKEVEEAGHDTDESRFAASQAQLHLEHQLDSMESNVYALAISTYALQLCESDVVDQALEMLEQMAIYNSGGMMYWEEGSNGASQFSDDWAPPYYSPPSQDIEISAYALLTYARRADINSAVPVLKWLTSKRNELGGYDSTQNTVIAIQAMSEIAKIMGDDRDLTISATHSNNDFQESVTIDDSNFVVYNVFHIPGDDGIVEVTAEGRGIAVAQLSVCYNIPDSPFDEEPFDCVSEVSGKGLDAATVDFCCRLRDGEEDATGMFVFEVELPNGFTVDIDAEKERNGDSQRVELVDRSANVYYDQLPPRKTICANVELMREAMVAKVKPVKAAAYDYYRMERRVTRSIAFDDFGDDACQVCGINCAGCPDPDLGEWELVKGCSNTCNDGSSSVWKRDCIDPSRGTVLPQNMCNLELDESFEERRPCSAPSFPECPSFHNGLWERAMPGQISFGSPDWGRQYQLMNLVDSIGCRRHPIGSEGFGKRGIPATYLGVQKGNVIPYIECGNGVSTEISGAYGGMNFYRGIDALTDEGFTLSFLLYVEEFSNRPKTQQLVTFGQPKMLPAFSFEKTYWRSQVSFRVRHYQHQFRVKNIPSRQLEGKWTHVVLAFNSETGAHVYFDGQEQGKSIKYNMRSAIIPKPFAEYQLFFGKDNYGGARGGVNAWVSSMDYWTRKFSAEEVQSIYNYFNPMIHTENNEDPVFTPLNWRQFAMEGTTRCYNQEMTLNQVTNWIKQQDLSDNQCFNIDPCEVAPDHPSCLVTLPEPELIEEVETLEVIRPELLEEVEI